MLTLITPPPVEPITRAEVRDHLNLTLVDNDESPPVAEPVDATHVDALIAAAAEYLDGPNGRLGRQLITATYRLDMPCFPAVIDVPLPPLQAVTGIVYIDPDGVSQTLPTADYEVAGVGEFGKGEVFPAIGKRWPATQRGPRNALQLTFRAGYGSDPANVPSTIRHLLKMLVAHFYEQREPIAFANASEIPLSVTNLIYSCRAFP